MASRSTTKQTRLNIRANRQQKQIIARAARLTNTTVSQFVLARAVAEAQEVLADQTRFRLSEKEWKAFCDLLDAPPRDLPEMRKLLLTPGVFDD